jgi:iron complex outermembrane receptor protein
VAAQNRIAENQGNVVGKDYDKSAGFGVFSLNGAYKINNNLKLSAGVDNLFDKAYAEHLNLAGNAGFGYPANRRSRSTSQAGPSGPRSTSASDNNNGRGA